MSGGLAPLTIIPDQLHQLGKTLQERWALKILDDPGHPATILKQVSVGSISPSNTAECDWFNAWPLIGPHVRLCDWWAWKLCCDWCKLQTYICMPQPLPGFAGYFFGSPRKHCCAAPLHWNTRSDTLNAPPCLLVISISLSWVEQAELVTE